MCVSTWETNARISWWIHSNTFAQCSGWQYYRFRRLSRSVVGSRFKHRVVAVVNTRELINAQKERAACAHMCTARTAHVTTSTWVCAVLFVCVQVRTSSARTRRTLTVHTSAMQMKAKLDTLTYSHSSIISMILALRMKMTVSCVRIPLGRKRHPTQTCQSLY